MSQLVALQNRLTAFRHRRQLVRWGMAWMALATGVLAVLISWFALDVAFELSVAQRVAILVLGIAAVIWATKRFVVPWLRLHETDTDVALFVQSQHGIDSDLVAALQFERTGAGRWGSPDLQAAVVRKVAELSPHLDVAKGFDHGPFLRRARWLGAVLVLAIVIALLYPRHVAVFFSRLLLLSARHYPSDTTIEAIYVNGAQSWEWHASTARPRDVRAAKNRPLTFLIQCTGDLPESGDLEMRSLIHRGTRNVEITRIPEDEVAKQIPVTSAPKAAGAYYRAELPRVVEEFGYSLRLGDAWTDEAYVKMIEPPLVELQARVEPPKYAAGEEASGQSPRHLAVLEGSKVFLNVRSISWKQSDQPHTPKSSVQQSVGDAKRLKSATVKIHAGETSTSYELVKPSAEQSGWSLPDNTPLASVSQELRYEIQVMDHDGMILETPLRGLIQLKKDHAPSVVANVVHRIILPTAKPVIEYRVNDDYGIESLTLKGQIERQPGTTDSAAESVPAKSPELFTTPIPLSPLPKVGKSLPFRGQFVLDLAPFQLAKGDQLQLTLSVVDYRGEKPGQQELSEPILLEVSDEAGVLAAITEADERSEKRLSDVITQQLGVGGSK